MHIDQEKGFAETKWPLRLRACCGVLLALMAFPALGAQEVLQLLEPNIRFAKLAARSNGPICTVKYGAYEGIMLVDTGSSYTTVWEPKELIERPMKEWNIITEDVRFASDVGQTTGVEGIPLSVFSRPAVPSKILYVPRNPNRAAVREEVGVLGVQDLLDLQLRVQLNQQICEPDHRDESVFDCVCPMALERINVPMIAVRFPSLGQRRALLDTGFSGFLGVPESMVGVLIRTGLAKEASTIEVADTLGIHRFKCYLIREVQVGDFVFHDVEAVATPFPNFLLGVRFFRNFDCVFDFPEQKFQLIAESDDWPKVVPPDASGLVFQYDDKENLLIKRIHSRHVETAKVLQANDVITMFDGRAPGEFTYLQIRDRLCQAGTSVALRVRRGEKEFDVDLTLSYPFEYPPKWGDIIELEDEVNAFDQFLKDRMERREQQRGKNAPAGSKNP